MSPPRVPSPPGAETDPDLFKVLTEIDMIAHMAKNEFERLLPAGMTQAQFGVLNRITRLGTEESVTELAAAFQVTQPTMTSTLKRLSAKRYIAFKPDLSDRRTKRVTIAPEGRKMRAEIIDNLTPLMASQSMNIGIDNLETLLADLAKIRLHFEIRMGAGDV